MNSRSKKGGYTVLKALSTKLKLANKPNLTDNEKDLLEKAIEFLTDDHKRRNKELGLPEDTPMKITFETHTKRNEEIIQENTKISEEAKKFSREKSIEIRQIKKQIREDAEKIKKEMWDSFKKNTVVSGEKSIEKMFIETMENTDFELYNYLKGFDENPSTKKFAFEKVKWSEDE